MHFTRIFVVNIHELHPANIRKYMIFYKVISLVERGDALFHSTLLFMNMLSVLLQNSIQSLSYTWIRMAVSVQMTIYTYIHCSFTSAASNIRTVNSMRFAENCPSNHSKILQYSSKSCNVTSSLAENSCVSVLRNWLACDVHSQGPSTRVSWQPPIVPSLPLEIIVRLIPVAIQTCINFPGMIRRARHRVATTPCNVHRLLLRNPIS